MAAIHVGGGPPPAGPASVQPDLLPLDVVVHPQFVASAAAAVAPTYADARGDWFDTVTLEDGRLCLVLGDVAGTGPTALSTMSSLRSAVLLALTEDPAPDRVLRRVARFARRHPEAVGTTLAVAVADAPGERVRYALAGHPGPLHVPRAGAITLCPTGDGCLGAVERFSEHVVELARGDSLLFVSDGIADASRSAEETRDLMSALLVPARQENVDDVTAADRACHDVLHGLAHPDGLKDDAVVLAVRRRAHRLEQLHCTLPALPDTVIVVRRELAGWLSGAGVSTIDASSILHAMGELITNAVEHAYDSGTDHRATSIEVSAEMRGDGLIDLSVADTGRWRRHADQGADRGVSRGRGLHLAGAFVDRLTVTTSEQGTICRLQHRPSRPSTVLTDRRRPQLDQEARMRADRAGGRLTLHGAIDLDAADQLRLLLGRGSMGGTRELRVDLTGVTLLSSAAVGVLVEAGAADPRGVVRVEVEPGTPADRVLVRAGLRGN